MEGNEAQPEPAGGIRGCAEGREEILEGRRDGHGRCLLVAEALLFCLSMHVARIDNAKL